MQRKEDQGQEMQHKDTLLGRPEVLCLISIIKKFSHEKKQTIDVREKNMQTLVTLPSLIKTTKANQF